MQENISEPGSLSEYLATHAFFFKRELNNAVLIAVHPEKGVFLGVDEKNAPVFKPAENLQPEQKIPASANLDVLLKSGIYHPDLIRSDFLQVNISGHAAERLLKSDAIMQYHVRFKDITEPESPYKIQLQNVSGLSSNFNYRSGIGKPIVQFYNFLDRMMAKTIPLFKAETVPYKPC